jgi:GTP-binding protein
MKPVIAIVGRANVGKSTLFNRITKSRDAIVADYAGLTRDRHYGDARLGPREFIVVDTGGFEPESPPAWSEMARQTRQAVAEADAVIFVVDVRAVCRRRTMTSHASCAVAAKACGAGGQQGRRHDRVAPAGRVLTNWASGDPHPVSSAHGQGIRSLLEAALVDFPETKTRTWSNRSRQAPIRLAVAGRPNVGKSTLINAWLGEERLVAFDQPGTTRDAITCPSSATGAASS